MIKQNSEQDYDDDIVVLAMGHPLTILNKYENLKSLKLVLPIFKDCAVDYYQSLLSMKCWTKHKKNRLKQCKLQDIELNFEIDKHVEKESTLKIIAKIWKYVLNHSTKTINFKCVINNHSEHKLKIKHSYLYKLNAKVLNQYIMNQKISILRDF